MRCYGCPTKKKPTTQTDEKLILSFIFFFFGYLGLSPPNQTKPNIMKLLFFFTTYQDDLSFFHSDVCLVSLYILYISNRKPQVSFCPNDRFFFIIRKAFDGSNDFFWFRVCHCGFYDACFFKDKVYVCLFGKFFGHTHTMKSSFSLTNHDFFFRNFLLFII